MWSKLPRLSTIPMVPVVFVVLLAGNLPEVCAQVPGVFTYHNDNARTGVNLQEEILTPSNVNTAQFGKLFSIAVDGSVYAQPLYVANVYFGTRFHNMVFVATEHDSVYAFDADRPSASALWHKSFIDPQNGITTVPADDTGECCDIAPEIGITGTPVIDPAEGILYVVVKTKEVTGGAADYPQRLHALDIRTGNEMPGSPVVIQANVSGDGDGSENGVLPFISLRENQRAALLLDNGVVYIAFASHGDNGPYHGWVLGYDAVTLHQVMTYCVTPNGEGGGVWHSGGGLAADPDGNIYFISGDGTFDAASGGADYGDSFIKLGSDGSVLDYFTPFDQSTLDINDVDLGSGGPLLIPDQASGPAHLVVGGGKEGTLYVVDRDSMGHFQSGSDSQIVQSLVDEVGPVFDAPAYFDGTVFLAAAGDTLRAYSLNDGQLSLSGQSNEIFGFPGATPAVSANGSSNGIVWALQSDQYGSGGPAVLHAYSAAASLTELYNSSQNLTRDNPGPAVKFTVPTIANGKVYVGVQNGLSVFGPLQDSDSDGIPDAIDNCIEKANIDQRDTDGDGYGNRCDGDFDQSNFVNATDLAILKSRFGTSDADADLDGSGFVNAADMAAFKALFGAPPGPSCCGGIAH